MNTEGSIWRVTGASVAGTAHSKSCRKCEDAHRWQEIAEGTVIVAVGDGAGSASRGGDGARLAVDAAIHALIESATPGATASEESIRASLSEALTAARSTLAREADKRALLMRDYATTLILLVATPQIIAAAQVGDGASIVRDARGGLTALTQPGSDGYINETTFLTSYDALSAAQIGVRTLSSTGFAVFTDGLQMLALQMPEGSPHSPFFAPLFQFAERISDESQAQKELIDFLRSPKIVNRTDDDLTLVLGTSIR
jgi:hypothetical protein